jgi:hypothetical protein
VRNLHTDFHGGWTDIPTNSVQGLSEPASLQMTAVVYVLDGGHSDWGEVESQCSFDLHFPCG